MAKVEVKKTEFEAGEQARQVWQYVKDQQSWDALTNAQKNELVRRVIRWLLLERFRPE